MTAIVSVSPPRMPSHSRIGGVGWLCSARRMRPEVIQPFWAALQAGEFITRGRARRGVPTEEGCCGGWPGGVRDPAASWPSSDGSVSDVLEREEIALGRARGESVRCIARGLGRAPSTVSRELSRNADRRGDYRATSAHALAWQRASRPKPAKLWVNQRLREIVEHLLERRYSPEQIAGRLRVQFPDDPEMWVSTETIYQSLYVTSRGALRRELTKCLRTGRSAAPSRPQSQR